MADGNRIYRIELEGGRLTVVSTSFRAEGESMLHSGVYNRELTSSLAAGALTLAAAVALYFVGLRGKAAHVAIAALVFVASFLAFRLLVFRDDSMAVVFDRPMGTVTVRAPGPFQKEKAYSFYDLKEVRAGRRLITPQNPDGIKFVEKIALQHGTAMPGFGEAKDFHTVEAVFKDGHRVTVFSTLEPASAQALLRDINSYLAVKV
jgi:hypothetical protein